MVSMTTRQTSSLNAQPSVTLDLEEDLLESQDDLIMHEAKETVTLGRYHFKKSQERPQNLTYTLSREGEFPGFNAVSVVEQARQELKEYSKDKDRELSKEAKRNVSALQSFSWS